MGDAYSDAMNLLKGGAPAEKKPAADGELARAMGLLNTGAASKPQTESPEATKAMALLAGDKPIQDEESFTDYLGRRLKEEGRELVEHPGQVALAIPKTIAQNVASLYEDVTDDPSAWEWVTDQKWMDEKELQRLAKKDPRVARKQRRQQQTAFENVGEEVGEMASALGTIPVAAAEGLAKAREKYLALREQGVGVGDALSQASEGSRDMAKAILRGVGESVTETILDPTEMIHESPIETLGNVAMGAGVAAKGLQFAGKGAQAAKVAQFARNIEPVGAAFRGARKVAEKSPLLRETIIRPLFDKSAGVADDVLRTLTDDQRRMLGQISASIDDVQRIVPDAPPEVQRKILEALTAEELKGGKLPLSGFKTGAKEFEMPTGMKALNPKPQPSMRFNLTRAQYKLMDDIEKMTTDKAAAKRFTVWAGKNPDQLLKLVDDLGLDPSAATKLRDAARLYSESTSELKHIRGEHARLVRQSEVERLGDVTGKAVRGLDGEGVAAPYARHTARVRELNELASELKTKLRKQASSAKVSRQEALRAVGAEFDGIQQALSKASPETIDLVRKIALGKKGRLAQAVDETVKSSRLKFSVGGTQVGTVRWLLDNSEIDPAKLSLEFLDDADDLKPYAEDLLNIRRNRMELAKDAGKIYIGDGKYLLGAKAERARAGTYLADIYDAQTNHAGLGMGDYGGFMAATDFKDIATLQEKIDAGLLSVDDLKAGLIYDTAQKQRTMGTFGIFDNVSKNELYAPYVKAIDDVKATAKRSRTLRNGLTEYVMDNGDRFIVDGRRTASGQRVFGALSEKAVAKGLYNALDTMIEETSSWKKMLRRVNNAWKSGKVLMNPASHFNQMFDNLIVKQLMDGGTPFGGIADAALSIKGRDKYYQAALRTGILDEMHTSMLDLTDPIMDDLIKAARGTKKGSMVFERWWNNATGPAATKGEKAVGAYTYAMQRSWLAKKAAAFFKGSDDLSRVAILRRWVNNAAKQSGRSVDDVLAEVTKGNTALARQAREHLADFFFDYKQNIGSAIQWADQYGAIPFSRYSVTATGKYIDKYVRHPFRGQVLREAEQQRYYRADPEERARMDQAPAWHLGRTVNIDALARLAGAEKGQKFDLSAARLTPMPGSASEMLNIRRGGSFGAEQFSKQVKMMPSGLLTLPLELMMNKSFEFDRPLDQMKRGVIGEMLPPRLEYALKALAPGFVYHLDNKIFASLKGRKDSRGREMKPSTALMHAMGIRAEPSDINRVRGWIGRGAKQARQDAKSKMKSMLRQAATPAERRKAQQEYRKRLREIDEIRAYLLGSHY